MHRLAIGIDIGGTNTKAGLVDLEEGEVLETLISPTEKRDPDCFLEAIGEMVDSTYGFLDFMEDYPLVDLVEEKCSLPCRADNDARVVALGEALYGMGKGYDRVLVLTLGTGLGVGFVAGGRFESPLPYGHMGGHISIDPKGAIWCSELFESYTAITNTLSSTLNRSEGATENIELLAGDEAFSSSKTYINTLLALYKGFGMDPEKAIRLLTDHIEKYEAKGKEMAREVFELIEQNPVHGIYITGSGPNIATAYEGSLILSESTKRCFTGLPMAQYDHGPKETSSGSIVIQILARGKAYDRTLKLNETISRAGARVLTVEEPEALEEFSIMHNMVPFNFMACYLAGHLGINETFVVGGKVTESE